MEEGLEPGCVPSDPVLPDELCLPAAAKGSAGADMDEAVEVATAPAEEPGTPAPTAPMPLESMWRP